MRKRLDTLMWGLAFYGIAYIVQAEGGAYGAKVVLWCVAVAVFSHWWYNRKPRVPYDNPLLHGTKLSRKEAERRWKEAMEQPPYDQEEDS